MGGLESQNPPHGAPLSGLASQGHMVSLNNCEFLALGSGLYRVTVYQGVRAGMRGLEVAGGHVAQ